MVDVNMPSLALKRFFLLFHLCICSTVLACQRRRGYVRTATIVTTFNNFLITFNLITKRVCIFQQKLRGSALGLGLGLGFLLFLFSLCDSFTSSFSKKKQDFLSRQASCEAQPGAMKRTRSSVKAAQEKEAAAAAAAAAPSPPALSQQNAEAEEEPFQIADLVLNDDLEPDADEEEEEEEDGSDSELEEDDEDDEEDTIGNDDDDSLDELSTIHSSDEDDTKQRFSRKGFALANEAEVDAWRKAHPEAPKILAEEESDNDDFELVAFSLLFFLSRERDPQQLFALAFFKGDVWQYPAGVVQ
jgi:hypothetical protein